MAGKTGRQIQGKITLERQRKRQIWDTKNMKKLMKIRSRGRVVLAEFNKPTVNKWKNGSRGKS